jgi:hypothetical protein
VSSFQQYSHDPFLRRREVQQPSTPKARPEIMIDRMLYDELLSAGELLRGEVLAERRMAEFLRQVGIRND